MENIKELEESLNDEYSSIPLIKVLCDSKINFDFNKQIVRYSPHICQVSIDSNKQKICNIISTIEFREKIKKLIEENSSKVNPQLFSVFINKYKSNIFNKKEIFNKAIEIKNNINYISDFLRANGILLLIEDCTDKKLLELDGFSCFYKDYKVIVVYKKDDKRKMLSTILYELYYLMYSEDDNFADKFVDYLLSKIE